VSLTSGPRRPRLLHVLHGGGGGLDIHVCHLVRATAERFDHWLLRAAPGGWRLTPPGDPAAVGGAIRVRWGNPVTRLARRLDIAACHVHHVVGAPGRLLRALATTPVPFGVTVHDFFWVCPRLHLVEPATGYCGAPTDTAVCAACLRREPRRRVRAGAWRRRHARVLHRARFVACPTAFVRDVMARHFPSAPLRLAPHAYRPPFPPRARDRPPGSPVTVAVIGALGVEKGGLRVERLARRTCERGLPIRWLVLGDTLRHGGPQSLFDERLLVHGGYRHEALPELLARYDASLVAFPAEGPETWSLTLDESWACGLPTLVPDLGALAERVRATGAGWIVPEWQCDDPWLDAVVRLQRPEHRPAWYAAAAAARQAAAATAREPPVARLYEQLVEDAHRAQ